MENLLRSIPDAWGPKCQIDDRAMTWTRTGPDEIALTPPAHLALIMLTPQPRREVSLGSDRRRIGLAPIGAVEIVPAGADLFARWVREKENMLLMFDVRGLADLAASELGAVDWELQPPKAGTVDTRALMLAQMARDELARGASANPLCLESLMLLLSVHLLRSYSSHGRRREAFAGGLSPRALRIVVDHVEDNLGAKLSISRLAGIAGLSPGHFLRAFRTTVGQAPHQYVLARRLVRAERMIATSALPFDAVAAAVGFCSNSHMTATMKRMRGRTPKDLRREALRPDA